MFTFLIRSLLAQWHTLHDRNSVSFLDTEIRFYKKEFRSEHCSTYTLLHLIKTNNETKRQYFPMYLHSLLTKTK